jgi:hypothetical protein
MMKKIIALAAGALFSLNASAGYVKYDLSGDLVGYVLQHDDDGSIADYKFYLPVHGYTGSYPSFAFAFYPIFGEGANTITGETTHFRQNGPTNFTMADNFGGDHAVNLTVDFARTTAGEFVFTGQYSGWAFGVPNSFSSRGSISGFASAGPIMATHGLDFNGGYNDGVPKIIPAYIGPNNVPEPASLALFAIGALGAAGVARRRKKVA